MSRNSPRFHIGIDLGTTNSSLAYLPSDAPLDESPKLLAIPQWENEEQTIEDVRLPSFLWILPKSFQKRGFAQDLLGHPQKRLAGRLAKRRSDNEPLEVIHSAKSWLSVGRSEQRTARILPWGSQEERISPLEAQAAYLSHLKDAWNLAHPDSPLSEQKIVITVPASFDELSQRLTLEAAKLAGLDTVELIEEPIAASYDWQADSQASAISPGAKILVVDIGGGTADFSLLRWEKEKTERLKVSDHLLLGGDNIDLLLVQRLAAKLSESELPRSAYLLLLNQARELKEKALAQISREDFHLSIPLDTKKLFGRYLSTKVSSEELSQWILEEFFPIAQSTDRPERALGLQTFGLPYAKDSRLTHHLAEFLNGESIDALLMVGGTLIPERLQDRIHTTLSSWQNRPILRLDAREGDLAIARGAARFAHKRSHPAAKDLIHSPYPRDLYVEVEGLGEICLIPKGHPRMQPYQLKTTNLHLRVGEEVKFQIFSKNSQGEVLPLSPLVLTISGQKKKMAIPVTLSAIVRETGVLEVQCDTELGRFTLDFAIETKSAGNEARNVSKLDFGAIKEMKAADTLIRNFYNKNTGAKEKAEKLPSLLEEVLHLSRDEWSAEHLRGLWTSLEAVMFQRQLSPEHEAIWFYLAGFALRPGFGYQGDAERILSLLRIYDESFRRVDQNAKLTTHWWILWRRIAGGLSADFQQKLFDRYIPLVRKEKELSPELIRLLGSLERLDITRKAQLGRQLLNGLQSHRLQADAKIWALARVAARYPVYAGVSHILPPSQVEEWGDEILALKLPEKIKANLYFAWAGKLRGDRRYDIDPAYRELFLAQLQRDDWRTGLSEVTELPSDTQAEMLADSLPSGFFSRS